MNTETLRAEGARHEVSGISQQRQTAQKYQCAFARIGKIIGPRRQHKPRKQQHGARYNREEQARKSQGYEHARQHPKHNDDSDFHDKFSLMPVFSTVKFRADFSRQTSRRLAITTMPVSFNVWRQR